MRRKNVLLDNLDANLKSSQYLIYENLKLEKPKISERRIKLPVQSSSLSDHLILISSFIFFLNEKIQIRVYAYKYIESAYVLGCRLTVVTNFIQN